MNKLLSRGCFLGLISLLNLLFFCSLECIKAGTINQEKEALDLVFLQKEQIFERQLKGSETHLYSIKVNSGELLHLEVEQKGIDVVVFIFDEKGKEIKQVDSPNGTSGIEPLYCLIETGGTHQVRIKSLDANANPGNYRVFVKEIRLATVEDREKIIADNLFYEAHSLQEQRKKNLLGSALEKYIKAFAIWEKFKDLQNQERCLKAIALVYLELQEFKDSIKYNEKALVLAEYLNNNFEQAVLLNEIGLNFYYLSNYNQSITFYEKALDILKNNDKELEAVILHNLGLVYGSLGEVKQSIDYYQKALGILVAANNLTRQPRTYLSLAVSYDELGSQKESLFHLRKALSLAVQVKDTKAEIEVLTCFGQVYEHLGDYQKSIEYYNKAFILNESIGDNTLAAINLNDLGFCYASLGDSEKATGYYNRALTIFLSFNYKKGESAVYKNLGLMYSSENNDKEALTYFFKSISLVPNESFAAVRAYLAIGKSYLNLKDLDNSWKFFFQALEKSRQLRFASVEVDALYGLAQIYFIKAILRT